MDAPESSVRSNIGIGVWVPEPCSHRGITPICSPNGLLTPHTDDAEKMRG